MNTQRVLLPLRSLPLLSSGRAPTLRPFPEYRAPSPAAVPAQARAQAPLGSLETVASVTCVEGAGTVHGEEVLVSPVPTMTFPDSDPGA